MTPHSGGTAVSSCEGHLQQRGQSVVVFVDDETVTNCLQHPEPGDRYEQRGSSIVLTVDIPDETLDSDAYPGPMAIYYPLWQAINDLTHAIEIWRCKKPDQTARPPTLDVKITIRLCDQMAQHVGCESRRSAFRQGQGPSVS
jgi:hypothetical protein